MIPQLKLIALPVLVALLLLVARRIVVAQPRRARRGGAERGDGEGSSTLVSPPRASAVTAAARQLEDHGEGERTAALELPAQERGSLAHIDGDVKGVARVDERALVAAFERLRVARRNDWLRDEGAALHCCLEEVNAPRACLAVRVAPRRRDLAAASAVRTLSTTLAAAAAAIVALARRRERLNELVRPVLLTSLVAPRVVALAPVELAAAVVVAAPTFTPAPPAQR